MNGGRAAVGPGWRGTPIPEPIGRTFSRTEGARPSRRTRDDDHIGVACFLAPTYEPAITGILQPAGGVCELAMMAWLTS